MKVIAAISINGVIGNNNKIPWHLSEDLKHFSNLTRHQNVIMGRSTYKSLPYTLPLRNNIILTKSPSEFKVHNNWNSSTRNGGPYYTVFSDGLDHLSSLLEDECLYKQQSEDVQDIWPRENWVIGGEQIYRLLAPQVNEMYITLILNSFNGDVYFPWECYTDFDLVSQSSIQKSKSGLNYMFLIYKRRIHNYE